MILLYKVLLYYLKNYLDCIELLFIVNVEYLYLILIVYIFRFLKKLGGDGVLMR